MSERLRFQLGDQMDPSTLRTIDDRTIGVVSSDGRVMFEVRVEDGRSIEVQAVNTCRVDGVRTSTRLAITPRYSNSILIGVHDNE